MAPCKNSLIIISSPSGAGKTSITKEVLKRREDVSLSVSVTTRKKREGEEDGIDYFFVSNTEFDDLISDKQLLEHAKVFNHRYGTPKAFVLEKLSEHKNIIFDIDWQGARQVSQHPEFNIISIFILPDAVDTLYQRLQKRNLDSEEIILNRMRGAKEEISHYHEYDYVVVNDDFATATQRVLDILNGKAWEDDKSEHYSEFVEELLAQAHKYI